MNESVELRIVATLGCDAGRIASLATRPELGTFQLINAATIDTIIESPDRPDVVIIGPDVPDPIASAQRLHLLGNDADVIILAHPRDLERLHRETRFAPRIGRHTVCLSDDDTETVARTIARATEASVTRRGDQPEIDAMSIGQTRRVSTGTMSSPLALRELLDALPLGVAAVDRDDRILLWNESFDAMLGLDRDLEGLPFVSLMPEDRRGEIATRLRAIGRRPSLQARTLVDIVRWYETLRLELTFSTVHTASEERVTIVSVRDTSLERQAAAAERTAAELTNRNLDLQNRLIVAAAHAAGRATDLTVALSETVRAVCETAGWPHGEAWIRDHETREFRLSNSWSVDPRFDPFTEAARRMAIAIGSGHPGEAIVTGRPQWITDPTLDPHFERAGIATDLGIKSAVVVPVAADEDATALLLFFLSEEHDEDPGVVRSVMTVGRQLGISIARHRAEFALHRSEQHFRAIVEGVHGQAIFGLDADGNISMWNAAASEMTGRWREEVLGRPLSALMAEDGDARAERLIETARATGRASDEGWYVSEQAPFWAEHAITRLDDADGTVVGFACILRDLTERRAQALALERRTEELARSNADLERFAGVAAHDLQEPLRGVAAFATLLDQRYRETLDETAREYLGHIQSGAERMHALVQDLLAFSMIGGVQADLRPTDLATPCAEAIENLAASIEAQHADVSVEGLPIVIADAGQIRQVFQNLVGNALKYTGGVEPRVRIWAERAGDTWTISIEDNGVGIPAEQHERIFHAFQRLSRTTHGSGIGLAICRRVIDGHGGRIWVDSTPGDGATFRFTLPAADPTAP